MRADLPEDRCECKVPIVKDGSVLCQKCLGNLPRRQLDDFTIGYLEAALWTEDPDPRSGEFTQRDGWGIENIDPASLATAVEDCARFQRENRADLDAAPADDHRHGVDFWLTRNGHGAGFWDRGYGSVGERLTEAAHAYGEKYLRGPDVEDNGASSEEQLDAWDGVIYID